MIRERTLAACTAILLTVLGFQQLIITPPALAGALLPAPGALA